MKGVEFKLHTVLAYMYISISQAKGKPVWTRVLEYSGKSELYFVTFISYHTHGIQNVVDYIYFESKPFY